MILICSLTFAGLAKDSCIPAKELIPYPEGFNIGMYQRVHPDGHYILHSSMENKVNVVLMDLRGKDEQGKKMARPMATPMNDEVYPATADWSLFSSPRHDKNTMHYYGMGALIKNGIFAKPVFKDSKHNSYYQSAGELPGSTATTKKIRVTLYKSQRTKELDLNLSKGEVVGVTEGKTGQICQNVIKEQKKPLTPERETQILQEIEDLTPKIEALRLGSRTSRNSSLRPQISDKPNALVMRLYELQEELNQFIIKLDFDSPVLSSDGTEVAANVLETHNGPKAQYTQRIYKINPDYSCEQVDDLEYETGKVQFSYPQKGKKGQLAFLGSASVSGKGISHGIFIYDRDSKKTIKIHDGKGAGSPGFTRDGRIIFPICESQNVENVTADERIQLTEENFSARDEDRADVREDERMEIERAREVVDEVVRDRNRERQIPKSRPIDPIPPLKDETDRFLGIVEMGEVGGIGRVGGLGGVGGVGVVSQRHSMKGKTAPRNVCGAMIVDPNQLNEDGTIKSSATSCISKTGKVTARSASKRTNGKLPEAGSRVR